MPPRYSGSCKHFNPRSPCGERPECREYLPGFKQFQSTLPVWGATTTTFDFVVSNGHFNPRSPCGERLHPGGVQVQVRRISIHAPRVGSDDSFIFLPPYIYHFNPRSPCGERQERRWRKRRSEYFNPRSPCGERPSITTSSIACVKFQSTLPVWGATSELLIRILCAIYFNPRSPCGERRQELKKSSRLLQFQSTLPVWGATIQRVNGRCLRIISIHAPRVGSDPSGFPIAYRR